MTIPRDYQNLDSLRVVYFGTYRSGYPRNEIMIEGLRQSGIEVIECHESLWRGIEDRVQIASGGWIHPQFWLRVIFSYIKLVIRYFQIRDYDILIVGYPGQIDIYLARVLSWIKKRPLVWDVFMSIFLISRERGLNRKSSVTTRFLYVIEKFALRLPDLLIQDTTEYVNWLCKTYKLIPERFRLVPTGADNRKFVPIRPALDAAYQNKFHIVYYGTFIPNHGVHKIIEAAALLPEPSNVCFSFIGSGPEQESVKQRSVQLGLRNVRFIDWLEKEKLTQYIANADLCLGAFGDTPQSLMTVQNKIYECLAMRKAVVTGDSPAVRQSFLHGQHLFICARTPNSLSEAIDFLRTHQEVRDMMAEQGYRLYCNHYSIAKLGQQYAQHLRELIAKFYKPKSRRDFRS